MAKRDYIIRFLLIIKKLRNSRKATFDEINKYLEREFELIDAPRNVSIRTFQRDLNEIRSIFNIDIKCNSTNQYYIDEEEDSNFNIRMMEGFDLFNSLRAGNQIAPFVLLENKCSQGTQFIYGVIHAIRNRHIIKIEYQKYYQSKPSTRELEPYALKEFKGRWYILAKDFKDGNIKTFALDRFKDMDVTKKKFTYPSNMNPKDFFKDVYGIIASNGSSPEEIVLSFDPYQGNYIKSYPLHTSQEIVKDDKEELVVSLKIHTTYDFLKELLSFGDNVKVIQPQSLIDEIKEVYQNALEQY